MNRKNEKNDYTYNQGETKQDLHLTITIGLTCKQETASRISKILEEWEKSPSEYKRSSNQKIKENMEQAHSTRTLISGLR